MTDLLITIFNSCNKVTIWGTLPIFLLFLLIIGMIGTIISKKDRSRPIDEIYPKRKKAIAQDVYEKRDYIFEIIWGVCVTFLYIPVLFLINIRLSKYIDGIINNVNVLCDIAVGLTAVVIAMGVVVIVFDKEYYLLFSVKQVLQSKGFVESLAIVLGSCVIICVMCIIMLDDELTNDFKYFCFVILEMSIVYNIVGAVLSLKICMDIMFSDRKKELGLLNQLYRRFWMCKINTIHTKKRWKKEFVEVNVKYLIEQYIDICKTKKIRLIKHIEFATTLGSNYKKWYNKIRRKLFFITGISLIISVTTCKVILQEDAVTLIITNIISAMFVVLCSCLNIRSFQVATIHLLSDTWGYYIYSKNNKEKFIPRIPFRKKNVYNKYLLKMNNLNAFFYVWLNDIQKKRGNLINQFKILLENIDEVEEKSIITYFPAFTIGFFLFQKKIQVTELKEIYCKYVVNGEQRNLFERMMNSQIFYLTRYIDYKRFGYKKELNEYLTWIEQVDGMK